MEDKLLQGLSRNFLRILGDDEYYDVIIEVGDESNVKTFHAHMVILYYRSTYLKKILSTNEKKNDGYLVQIKLPNISPEIFQIILRYIYGGTLSLEDYDDLDIIKILVAAGELRLHELIAYIESFLIENKADWMEQNFNLIYQASYENGSFLELQEYCTDLMSRVPDKIFKSLDLSSVPEKLIISLIQNNNLDMNEFQVWKNVLKWGLAQNPGLSSDPSNYSKNDFNSLKNTLRQCIPFVRFFNLTSKEFSDSVLPYKEILPEELFMNLLKSFFKSLHPDNNKSKPRMDKKTRCSVSFHLPPPSTSYYPESSTSIDPNSHKQNINKDKEVSDPLTSTQVQPLPKNPNCNEEKVSPKKSSERNRIRGRGSKTIKLEELSSHFIEDVNVPDGTTLAPQTQFIKTWKVSNNGRIPWPDRTVLRFIHGDRMFNKATKIFVGSVDVGKSVDIPVDLQAPSKRGKHMSYWQLTDGMGKPFGHRVWCDITVKDAD